VAKTLTVVLAADIGKFRRDMQQAEGGLSGFAGSLKNLVGPALIGATAAAGAFAVKLAVDGVKAAMDDEASLKSLAQTLENVGLAHQQPAIEEFISGLERSLGVADDELRPAYDRLARSTGNVAEANKALQIALDVSAGTGKSLSAVVEALGKAYDGNTAGLSRLGAGLDKATLSAGNLEQINGELSRIFAGQATTAASTYEGQLQRAQVAVDNLAEAMGKGLLSALGDTNDQTQDFVDTLGDLEDESEALGKLLGELGLGLVELGGNFAKVNENTTNFNKIAVANLAIGLAALADRFGLISDEQGAAEIAQIEHNISIYNGTQALKEQAEAARRQATAYRQLRRDTINATSAQDALNASQDLSATRFQILADLNKDPRWQARKERLAAERELTDELTRSTGAYTAKITEETDPAIERMTVRITNQLGALTEQVARVDAAAKALDGYAQTIKSQLLGGIDLKSVFDPEDAAGTIAAFTAQISDVTSFSESLAALGTSLPNTPGAQLLLGQIVGLGTESGKAVIAGMTTEVAQNLVSQLDNAITAVEGNSYLLANKFFGEGVEAAQQTLDGMITQILKDEKKLRDIGKSIGKPIGANIKAEIAASVAEAVAAAQAAGEAARAEAGAREAARQATLTEQAIAADLARLIRNSDARAGRNVQPVVR
jgi:hypothetical protein